MLKLDTVNKILIIRLSSLGDILLTTPLIRSIKNKFHDLQIDFLLKDRYSDVLKYNPHIRKLFNFKPKEDDSIEEISSNDYELIIDLQNNFRSKKILEKFKTKSAPHIVKFRKLDYKKFLLVNFKINTLKEAPPIPVRYSQTIGFNILDEKGLEIFLPEQIKSVLDSGENYIGFAPGSRHFTKMWPKEFYIYLAKILLARGFKVVLFGGKDDKTTCEEITKAVPDLINYCNDDNILQMAADMKKCKAIICNDSGLMHTACAVETPVLSFFGSTVKEFGFTPYKNKNLILENNSLSCRPCSHIGREECPKKHFKCMMELTPEQAFNKLNLLLNT